MKPNFVFGGYFPRTLDEHDLLASENQTAHQTDEYYMSRALVTAMNAVGWSAPNPSVGCVMVKNQKIISEGFTQAYKFEHAEKMAFKKIAVELQADTNFLEDATIYVTLEPCAHQGHQPPCLDLILNSKIKRVVIACVDPDDRVSGKSIEALTRANKEVIVGVLEKECHAWHFSFLESQKQKKKIWIAKWAQTKTGLLADASGSSKWISGPKSRAYGHWLRQKYDAILVGAGTWLTDRPQLTARDCAKPHRRNPLRLVYDPHHRLQKNAATKTPSDVIVFSDPTVSGLIESVNGLSIQSVMVEGGPTLLNLLFKEGIFDACHQFIGSKELVDASGRYQLTQFQESCFQRLVTQKIDDDLLHEWIKCH